MEDHTNSLLINIKLTITIIKMMTLIRFIRITKFTNKQTENFNKIIKLENNMDSLEVLANFLKERPNPILKRT